MGRFIFDLSDEQRVRLETYRASNGLRSLADALRHMIDGSPNYMVAINSGTREQVAAAQNPPGLQYVAPSYAPPTPSAAESQACALPQPLKRSKPKLTKPAPSRLKGEWSPPGRGK